MDSLDLLDPLTILDGLDLLGLLDFLDPLDLLDLLDLLNWPRPFGIMRSTKRRAWDRRGKAGKGDGSRGGSRGGVRGEIPRTVPGKSLVSPSDSLQGLPWKRIAPARCRRSRRPREPDQHEVVSWIAILDGTLN